MTAAGPAHGTGIRPLSYLTFAALRRLPTSEPEQSAKNKMLIWTGGMR